MGFFSEDRRDKHRNAKRIKCQASDALSLVGVAALFVMKVLMNLKKKGVTEKDCDKECKAFLALVAVIELILASARTAVQPERLLTAVEKFLHLFKDAWGCERMVSKFHWMLHFWMQLKRFQKMLACFCLERKHRVPKRYATELANISKKSSKSLLMEVTSHHLGQLSQPEAFKFDVGLVRGTKPSRRVKQILIAELKLEPHGDAAESILCSTETRFSPLATCHQGDMVLYQDGQGSCRAGRIQLHFDIGGHPLSMVSVFNAHKLDTSSMGTLSIWTPAESGKNFIDTSQILDTVVYSEMSDAKVALLMPLELR